MLKVAVFTAIGTGLLVLAFWWYFSRPGEILNPHDWMSDHFVPKKNEPCAQLIYSCISVDTEHYTPFVIAMRDTRDKEHPKTIEVRLDVCIKHGEFRLMK